MSPEWLSTWDKRLQESARDAAIRHGLDPNWVMAVIQTESAGNPLAVRFEPNWRWLHNVAAHAKRLKVTEETERSLQSFSWGPMQVMGSVAREWGYPDHLFTLCDPIRGLEYGCKHLAAMRKRFPTGRDWIAAYNGGSPRKNPDGTYKDDLEKYVKKVVGYWNELSDT